MTILQVTPEKYIEHTVFPGEELPHRLNTIEARRFIFGLANGERKKFESLVDQDGNPDPKEQEMFIIKRWSDAGDNNAIAGHNVSRALQSVRHFYSSKLENPDIETDQKRFYYPLLDTPKAPFVAELHWDQENRFRRGIGKVISSVINQPAETFVLPEIKRDATVPEGARHVSLQIGRLIAENSVLVHESGITLGSGYVFAIAPRQAVEA